MRARKGALTAAFVERWRGTAAIQVDAYEVDDRIVPALAANPPVSEELPPG